MTALVAGGTLNYRKEKEKKNCEPCPRIIIIIQTLSCNFRCYPKKTKIRNLVCKYDDYTSSAANLSTAVKGVFSGTLRLVEGI